MPATIEPAAEPGTTSVGSFLNDFLAKNPKIEQGLKDPINPADAAKPKEQVVIKQDPDHPLADVAKNLPGGEDMKPKEDKPAEAKPAPAKDKVFGTEAKPTPVDPTHAEETAGMTQKARDKWTALKTERDSATQRAEQLARDLEELGRKSNQDTELPKQLDTLKAELEAERTARIELEQQLSVAAVDHSKEFQREVAHPKATIEQQLDAIAKKYEIPTKKLISALDEPIEARADVLDEFTAEMRDMDKQTIAILARERDAVNRRAEELREKAKTSREHMQATQQTESDQSRKETQAAAAKMAERVWNEAAKTNTFLAGKTGDETWDKWVVSHRGEVLNTNLDDPAKRGEVLARAAASAPMEKALNHFRSGYEDRGKEIATLEARLARYEKAAPGVGGRSGEAKVEQPDDNRTPGERMMGVIGRRA